MSESTERRWLAVFSTEEGSEALREFLRDLDAVSGGEVAIAKVTPLFQEEGQTELRKWLRMVLGLPEGAKSRFQWLPPKRENGHRFDLPHLRNGGTWRASPPVPKNRAEYYHARLVDCGLSETEAELLISDLYWDCYSELCADDNIKAPKKYLP